MCNTLVEIIETERMPFPHDALQLERHYGSMPCYRLSGPDWLRLVTAAFGTSREAAATTLDSRARPEGKTCFVHRYHPEMVTVDVANH